MCFFEPPKSSAVPIIANPSNREASQEADAEALRRRQRAGAAAAILTGPRGIPGTTSQLGAPA